MLGWVQALIHDRLCDSPNQTRLQAERSARSIPPFGLFVCGAIVSLMTACNVSQPPTSSAISSTGSLLLLSKPTPTATPAATPTPTLSASPSNLVPATEPMAIVDRVIQSPNLPLPASVFKVSSLTADQIQALNELHQQFTEVNAWAAPIAPGGATVHSEWMALCLGEENQSGCPQSAAHQLTSHGKFWQDDQFVTVGGWVFYTP